MTLKNNLKPNKKIDEKNAICECGGIGLQSCSESAEFMKPEAVIVLNGTPCTLCYVCNGRKSDYPNLSRYARLNQIAKDLNGTGYFNAD